jgi:5-methylcytosine-specific restriction enzyme subunit McrC
MARQGIRFRSANLLRNTGHQTLRLVRVNAISVFEHEPVRADAPLTPVEKNALERLNNTLGEEVFQIGWREVRATSFVGVVQLASRVIQILPKIYRDDEHREEEATSNLLFLLHYTRKLEVSETEIAMLREQKAPLSEVLYWVFARRLWEAVRREVLRGYVPIEERLGLLKGKWRVATQCRSAGGWRKDVFDVAYDEFTEDNLPNQLLKAAVDRVATWARWAETRRYLTQLRSVYADVAERVPTVQDFEAAEAWMLRYRRRAGAGHVYRPLLNMARMFMVGSSARLSVGKTECFAYVFNMYELFEEFVAEFIRRELRQCWGQKGWQLRSQLAHRALLQNEKRRGLFWLKPDIRFETAGGGHGSDCGHQIQTAGSVRGQVWRSRE